jgi:hypothetical protein
VAGAGDFGDTLLQADLHAGCVTFREQHGDDFAGGAVAEELAQGFFVPGDTVAVDEGEEVARGVAGEGGTGEVGVGGEEAVRGGVQVGEIATPAAGNANWRREIGPARPAGW